MTSGVDAKLLKSTKFPPEYSKKVDREKVNLEVMKQWISGQVIGILGNEDDVVIDFIFGMLEEERFPDPKKIQINLTGFLEKDTAAFCKQMWNLLLSAQANPQGVPTELLEQKKEELRQQRAEAAKITEAQQRKREEEEQKDRSLNEIRDRERGERRRGGPPPERGGRDIYQPRLRHSASPVNRRRRSPEILASRPPPRREVSPPPRGGARRERFRERRETDTQEHQVWTFPVKVTLATAT
ncbi:uncharacterized protein LAJ45_11286 [Morchella importuna]|uniref:uncharacterized protein n=1 Tax=Morchella importuna TaxID=1174673 RepID=UPI001E8D17DE|nr:uncharacterized protein LAJ45_11286 [Morchella importuna]KAH8144692.1 hypothetical protein LAJ45_11286 [Morchella importuna]